MIEFLKDLKALMIKHHAEFEIYQEHLEDYHATLDIDLNSDQWEKYKTFSIKGRYIDIEEIDKLILMLNKEEGD